MVKLGAKIRILLKGWGVPNPGAADETVHVAQLNRLGQRARKHKTNLNLVGANHTRARQREAREGQGCNLFPKTRLVWGDGRLALVSELCRA